MFNIPDKSISHHPPYNTVIQTRIYHHGKTPGNETRLKAGIDDMEQPPGSLPLVKRRYKKKFLGAQNT